MASLSVGSAFIHKNVLRHNLRLRPPQRLICKSMAKTSTDDAPVYDLVRRSGNYQPSSWDHSYLLSIENKYVNEKQVMTRDVLKKQVKKMFDDAETKSRLELLELIDDLQKLGISYHFEFEINNILTDFFHRNENNVWKCDKEENLYATALEFRLLRQHGLHVSEDTFDAIINKIEQNMFKGDDIRSIITLYEASYLSTKLDTKLQKIIRPFAIQQIRKFVDSDQDDGSEIREMAIHALEMPYHWRMRRLETRWYIDSYEKKHNMNPLLIKFTKIDFNIVQTTHQDDLKYVSSWWKETCLGNQLDFVRDNIVQSYLWGVGIVYEPQFGYVRRIFGIAMAFVTTIDDIYDIYGTPEELELFTSIVESWNVNRLNELPEYMRLSFLTLFNEINGIGCDILKSKNIDVIPFLKKAWADLCKSFLLEAKWYKGGYKPRFEEYLQNAWISVSSPTTLIHVYCTYSDQLSIQFLESLSQHHQKVVQYSSTIFRLANDLSTSLEELERGDVLKSVQCYMHENGVSEETACAHVRQMISDSWDEINYQSQLSHSSLSSSGDFVEAAMNLARTSLFMYQHGDGHGRPEKAKMVDYVQSLLVDPIPLD